METSDLAYYDYMEYGLGNYKIDDDVLAGAMDGDGDSDSYGADQYSQEYDEEYHRRIFAERRQLRQQPTIQRNTE